MADAEGATPPGIAQAPRTAITAPTLESGLSVISGLWPQDKPTEGAGQRQLTGVVKLSGSGQRGGCYHTDI